MAAGNKQFKIRLLAIDTPESGQAQRLTIMSLMRIPLLILTTGLLAAPLKAANVPRAVQGALPSVATVSRPAEDVRETYNPSYPGDYSENHEVLWHGVKDRKAHKNCDC